MALKWYHLKKFLFLFEYYTLEQLVEKIILIISRQHFFLCSFLGGGGEVGSWVDYALSLLLPLFLMTAFRKKGNENKEEKQSNKFEIDSIYL